MRASPLLLLVLGCSHYAIIPAKDAEPADDTAPVDTPEEGCDGIDDDGDGVVDDGFGDVDGDGTADCVDDACDVALAGEGTTEKAECATGVPSVSDPWRPRVRWEWDGGAGGLVEAYTTPLVAEFDDDNGDGVIDLSDTVDVMVIAAAHEGRNARIVLLDGATGEEKWDAGPVGEAGGPAIGDLDGDGAPEIVAFDEDNRPMAFDAHGTLLWTAETVSPDYIGGMPAATIADLDGDGHPEVLANHLVLDGVTGETLRALPEGEHFYFLHAVGDLDLDGQMEEVFDGSVYRSDGTLYWTGIPSARDQDPLPQPVIADVDGDPEGEVILVEHGLLHVYDTDGTVLAEADVPQEDPGPPCLGDFDGDGQVELAVPFQTQLNLYEVDGTLDWSVPTQDTSSMAGCSGADLDGDGAVEVVYADERDFFVLDGRTGAALLTDYDHGSGTLIEYPTIIDLDGDGHAEILVVNNWKSDWGPVVALDHDGEGWTAAPRTWESHDRVPGRFGPAGQVLDPGPWWQTEDTFRSIPSDHQPVLEMKLLAGDVCVSACDAPGVVSVAVQVANTGEQVIPAGMVLRLFRLDGAVQTFLAETATTGDIAPGATSASIELSAPADQIGIDGLVVRVNDDMLALECDESDDSVVFADVGC